MSRFRFTNSMMLLLLYLQVSHHALLYQMLASRTMLLPLYYTSTCLISWLSKYAIKPSMYSPLKRNYLPLDMVSTKQLISQISRESSLLLIHCTLQREFLTCPLIPISYNLLLCLMNWESSSIKASTTALNFGTVPVKKTGISIQQSTKIPKALLHRIMATTRHKV